jgi:hypothetical protein
MGEIAHARMSQMTRKPALVDLKMQGVQELIRLTNQQFRFWGDALAAGTSEEIRPGDLMDYWFILSALAQYPPEFRLNKKEAFSSIPNLKPETVRRYVADAGRLGFVETVKSKGKVYLQDRVPDRGVAGGGTPRSPARAGQVSWRSPGG